MAQFNPCSSGPIHIFEPYLTITAPAYFCVTWWRHQMEPFSALLAICAGNSPVTGEFIAQRPVTRSFGVFFDLRLYKRLSKQSSGWWFETPSRSLWRHRNAEIERHHNQCSDFYAILMSWRSISIRALSALLGFCEENLMLWSCGFDAQVGSNMFFLLCAKTMIWQNKEGW